MTNPKICKNCGRVMEKDDDTEKFVCLCGNEEQIWYGRKGVDY
ncbi:MAG: hypothetical protein AABY22_13815 [Nanoarchaeota archaeon]